MSLASRKADLLVGLEAGVVSLPDVIRMARSGDEAAAGLSLRHVLTASSTPQVQVVLERYHHLAGGLADPPLRFVVEPKARGKRLAALAAALEWRPGAWPGFPWTQPPAGWWA